MKKDTIIDATLTGVMLTVAVAVVAGMLMMMLLTSCSSGEDKKKGVEAQELAMTSLRLQVDNPDALKVLAISKPDSVFGRNFITTDEMEIIFKNLHSKSELLMNPSNYFDADNEARCMKQVQRCTQLSNLMMENAMGVDSSEKFTGWKVKVLYDYNDNAADTTFRNERYFILDKEQNHILHSFEIPIL